MKSITFILMTIGLTGCAGITTKITSTESTWEHISKESSKVDYKECSLKHADDEIHQCMTEKGWVLKVHSSNW